MEPTFKIILDRVHPKKDLTLPLRIRVYQGRKYKEQTLGISIPESDWNEQLQTVRVTNPSHKVYNAKIASIKAKIQKSIFLNDEDETSLTPEEVIRRISRKKPTKVVIDKTDILGYGKAHIAKLVSSGHIGNSIVYSCAVNKLKEYTSRENLSFEEVNYSFLQGFNTSLLTDGMKINGISNYLRTIRALFNKAIKEGIVSVNNYPFSQFKIKYEKTINRTLTIEEIANIATYDLTPDSKIWHYRNLFLLSYCLIGVNFADMLTLKKENLVDGRVVFRRKKTHKVYSILLQPKAEELFNLYSVNRIIGKNAFLLPFIENKNNPVALKKDILQVTKNTNEYLDKLAKLCKISKPITTYYARYSWANAARNLGYSKDLIAEALGHEYGNKVTGIYLDNYSNAILDEMNAKVIEHSLKKPSIKYAVNSR